MSKRASFAKQAAVLAIASLLVRFLGFLYRLPLTKLIGDEGNGIYSAGYYLYTFFLIVSSAGFPAAISKMISERVAKSDYAGVRSVFRAALITAFFSGFSASVLVGFGARYLSNMISSPKSFYSILSLSPTVFIVAIMAVFRGYFQGLKNTWPTAISQVIEQVFNAVFSVWLAFVLVKKSVALGAAGGTIGTGVGAFCGLVTIVSIYFYKRKSMACGLNAAANNDLPQLSRDFKSIFFELVKTSAPIIIGTAVFSVTNLIDMKMVMVCLKKNFSEQQANVLYGQLTGKYVVLTTLPVSIATAVATAIVPNIASSFVLKDFSVVRKKINSALRITMILSIPAAVGIGVLGKQILIMLFPDYPDGAKLLAIGAVSIIFLALAQVVTGILQGINKLRTPAVAAFLGALVKIPLNYFLITNPNINVLGAVISTIACYLVASIVDLIVMSRTVNFLPDVNLFFVKPLIASGVMGLFCHFFYDLIYFFCGINSLALILSIMLGAIVYLVFLVIIKGVVKEDIELIPICNKIYSKVFKAQSKN